MKLLEIIIKSYVTIIERDKLLINIFFTILRNMNSFFYLKLEA